MGEPGTLERLLTAVERLDARLNRLESRLGDLEGAAPGPPERSEPPPEEREGVFGPAIKRSDSSRHRDSVSRALSMLGIVAEPTLTEERKRKIAKGHARALARMKRLSGIEVEGSGEEEEGEAAPVPAGSVATAATAAIAPDPDAPVPLPEVVLRPAREEAHETVASTPPVDLEGALAIDLGKSASLVRARPILALAVEVAAIGAILLAVPGPVGVLAGLPFVALLAAPFWGTHVPTLRAHARFLALVLIARSLAPDMLLGRHTPEWWNLRFGAMAAAALPAFAVVVRGGVGFWVMAAGMSTVLGGAVGAESRSPLVGVLVGLLLFASSVLWRGRR